MKAGYLALVFFVAIGVIAAFWVVPPFGKLGVQQ